MRSQTSRAGAEISPRPARRRARSGLVLALAGWITSVSAHAAPFVPKDDQTVLETIPDAADRAGGALRALQRQLAERPDDLPLAMQVARANIDHARRFADPRYLGRAEAALARWQGVSDPPTPDLLVLRATLRQSVHDFPAARALLDQAIARAPRMAEPYLIRAAVATVQADYTAALADCGHVGALRGGIVPVACTASVVGIAGRAPLALAALEAAWPGAAAEPDAVRVWARTLMGELAARTGQAARADALFRDAREIDPEDAYLLGAYADFLLDSGRPAEAVALLRAHGSADALLLRLAIAEDEAGQRNDAHVAELEARFAAARWRGETLHRREEARFALTLRRDPARAVMLAQDNWQVQREPADARVLLEAALAARAPDAAAPVLRWMTDTGIGDPILIELRARLAAADKGA